MVGRSAQVARGLNTISANIIENSDLLLKYGIEVKGANGELKSTYDVLKKLKPIWDNLTDAERQSLGQALAGKNQYRVLAAVMQNFQHAVEATKTAVNSAGSAMDENTAYMESLESKTTLLKSTFQTLANDVIPKELIAKGLDVLDKFLKILDTDLGVFITKVTLLTGIGWGFSSLVSASKILPTIISQFSNFVKLLSGATVIIPETAAAVGGLTKAMAVFHSTALPIIGVLALLSVAAYETVKSIKENKARLDELVSSVNNFNTTIKEVNKNAAEEKAKIEATTSVVGVYIKRIEELDKKTALNNAEQTEYHNLLQKIIEVMPSLASSIDLQNNKIIGGTSAIYDQIEAWKELAKQQAYQSQLSNLYAAQAQIDFQIAENQIKLQQAQADLEAAKLMPEGKTKSVLGAAHMSERDLAIASVLQEIKDLENAVGELEKQREESDSKIQTAETMIADIFGTSSKDFSLELEDDNDDIVSWSGPSWEEIQEEERKLKKYYKDNFPGVYYYNLEQNPELGWGNDDIVPWSGPSWEEIQEEKRKLEEYYKANFPGVYYHNLEQTSEDVVGGITTTSQEALGTIGEIEKELLSIQDIIDSYVGDSDTYKNLLESQYDLMVLQNDSEEDIVSKVKEIQNVDHEVAETLRVVLQNADKLNLTTEDIYEIQTLINERSIDWWNWQNKIKTDSEEIVDNYEQIEEASEDIRESQIAMLNQEKDAISALSSTMVDYYDEQIDKIDNQIQALKDSNAEIEEQIALEEKLDAVARARQNKVYVYKEGRFQYVEDTDAVSSAQKDLDTYKRQQKLEQEIAGLETERQALEDIRSTWADMVSDYEEEQDRWLISQELGINTSLEGWERFVSGVEKYFQRYKQIMSDLSRLESEKEIASEQSSTLNNNVSGGKIEYDPNLDYSDLILQSTTITEAKHWATKRDAKIKGEGLSPEKSTQEFLNEWQENYNKNYANGTLSAVGGMSLVGERGAELRILNQGDGIIPATMTSNLMSWGTLTPNQFKTQIIDGFNHAMNVTIQALNLPNVSDGAGFVDYVRNNMFGQVLSLVH